MGIQVDAVFFDGAFHPKEPIALPEGAEVRIAVEAARAAANPAGLLDDPLAAVIGVGEGPAAGDSADRHDPELSRHFRSA